MRVDHQISICGSGNQKGTESSDKTKQQQRNGSFYFGDTNLIYDSVKEKKEEAQKKALKIVGDAWNDDSKVDDDLNDRRQRVQELFQNAGDAGSKIADIESDRLALKEEYGIAEDSEEQSDLLLLTKESASNKIGSNVFLTSEEKGQLQEIHKKELTEYQSRSLLMNSAKAPYETIIRESKKSIIEENAIIRGIEQERLKSSPMVEAQNQADEIMDTASDEAKGMLLSEVKDNIDQKAEETKEKADDKQEKEDTEQEKMDIAKERKKLIEALADPEQREKETVQETQDEEQEVPVEEFLQMDLKHSDLKKEVDNIVTKMALVAEDIKGSVVDLNL